MTYNVFSGTLNPTHLLTYCLSVRIRYVCYFWNVLRIITYRYGMRTLFYRRPISRTLNVFCTVVVLNFHASFTDRWTRAALYRYFTARAAYKSSAWTAHSCKIASFSIPVPFNALRDVPILYVCGVRKPWSLISWKWRDDICQPFWDKVHVTDSQTDRLAIATTAFA